MDTRNFTNYWIVRNCASPKMEVLVILSDSPLDMRSDYDILSELRLMAKLGPIERFYVERGTLKLGEQLTKKD